MKQTIRLTESVLRNMIIRAINESLEEFDRENFQSSDISLENWKAIKNWAEAVRKGVNYKDDRIFTPFFNALSNNARLKYIVLKAFGYENTALSTKEEINDEGKTIRVPNPEKPSLDTYRMCSNGMDEGVINSFFAGISNLTDEENSDAFPGNTQNYNLKEFVNIILNEEPIVFIHKLSNLLGFYARHYFRKHYKENVINYGNISKSMDNPTSNPVGYDTDDYEADAVADTEPTDSVGSVEQPLNNNNGNVFYSKLINQVKKILKDPTIQLRPQEKAVLTALIDISTSPLSQDKINQMAELSSTQQIQMIYKEVAERTGLPVDRAARLISLAINKAKKSEYAKIDERKQKMVKLIVNEVIKRILNESK